VIGLAFKENTDDLRESPVVSLLEQLIGKGREIRVFDPHIQLDSIYGSNRNFIVQQIPHIGKLLDRRIEDTIGWAEHLVIAQKPSPETLESVGRSGLPITNLVS
jgi:GDP-mannose 6-dehydrogenase